jgi:hypothetical protein
MMRCKAAEYIRVCCCAERQRPRDKQGGAGLLGYLTAQGAVPPVLDRVVRSAREQPRDLGPPASLPGSSPRAHTHTQNSLTCDLIFFAPAILVFENISKSFLYYTECRCNQLQPCPVASLGVCPLCASPLRLPIVSMALQA